MKYIDVFDDKKKKFARILFDGKKIRVEADKKSDKEFIEGLLLNAAFLPKDEKEKFEFIPERFSNLSRIIFGDIQEKS